jgi:hypothetical protein
MSEDLSMIVTYSTGKVIQKTVLLTGSSRFTKAQLLEIAEAIKVFAEQRGGSEYVTEDRRGMDTDV